MSGPQFFETQMGRRYYERDVPRMVTALEQIAEGLAKSVPVEQLAEDDKPHLTANEAAVLLDVYRGNDGRLYPQTFEDDMRKLIWEGYVQDADGEPVTTAKGNARVKDMLG